MPTPSESAQCDSLSALPRDTNGSQARLTLAIATPTEPGYSETFIEDHIQRLPGRVIPLYGAAPALLHEKRYIAPVHWRFFARDLSPRIPRALVRFAKAAVDRRTAKFLRSRGVDVVLAEYCTEGIDILPACRMAGIPLVVHCHGFDVYKRDVLEQAGDAYRALFEGAALFIVGSRDMAAQAETIGIPAAKIRYVPCGVDPSLFAPVKPSANPLRIVSVGRFVPKKAPHLLLLAFEKVKSVLPEAELVMAGQGPLLEACRQMALALGIDRSVAFAGSLDHAQVRRLLATARVFAQHSVTAPDGDSEGTAISILEAAATGLPVVATAHGGIKDTMVHQETAILVPEYDVARMGEALLTVLANPNLADQLGRSGRQRVCAQFTMDGYIAGIAGVLREAQSGQPGVHAAP